MQEKHENQAMEGEVRVRNVRAERTQSLAGTLANVGGGVARLGFSVVTLPVALLPAEPRQHLRNASRELLYAAAMLPGELAQIAGDVIDDWAQQTGAEVPKQAPHDEMAPASGGNK